MPDGSNFSSTHLPGVLHPTRLRVTPEMRAAGAAAMAKKYLGMAIDLGGAHPKILSSDGSLGIAAADAYLAMEQVNEQGERDHLQHPGLFGCNDPLIWQGMTPSQRAEFIQSQSANYLLGAVGMMRGFRSGIKDPMQNLAVGMLCDSLTALARDLQRASTVKRRTKIDIAEREILQSEAEDARCEELRRRDNEARADRRRRAKDRTAAAPVSELEMAE